MSARVPVGSFRCRLSEVTPTAKAIRSDQLKRARVARLTRRKVEASRGRFTIYEQPLAA